MNTQNLMQHLSELYYRLPVGAEDKEDWSPEFAELVKALAEDPFYYGDDWLGDLALRLQRLGDAVVLCELDAERRTKKIET